MQPTHGSSRLLRPVHFGYVWLVFLLALVLNFIPSSQLIGVPDWVALALAFWAVREPRKVGLFTAFLLGVVMDVADGSLMGQHALAYVLLAFLCNGLSRRILWFSIPKQALQVFPLLLLMQVIMVLVRLIAGDEFPGWFLFFSSVAAAMLWTPLAYIILLPQFQPSEKDDTRPLSSRIQTSSRRATGPCCAMRRGKWGSYADAYRSQGWPFCLPLAHWPCASGGCRFITTTTI
jgi:rod shape-determining protein MreD